VGRWAELVSCTFFVHGVRDRRVAVDAVELQYIMYTVSQ